MPASMSHLETLVPSAQSTQQTKTVLSVLAKWTDGLYYKVDLIKQCDKAKRQCLVVFEDKLEKWIQTSDLHIQLDLDELGDEHIVCCVCEDGTSAEPNEIVMCDACQQGYHVECHEAKIDREKFKLEDDLVEWTCSTCTYLQDQPKIQAAQVAEERTKSENKQPTKKRAQSTGGIIKLNGSTREPKTPKTVKISSLSTTRATKSAIRPRKSQTEKPPAQATLRESAVQPSNEFNQANQMVIDDDVINKPTESPKSKESKGKRKPVSKTVQRDAGRRILRGGESEKKLNGAKVLTENDKLALVPVEEDFQGKVELVESTPKMKPLSLNETPPNLDTPSDTSISSSCSGEVEQLPCGVTIEKADAIVIQAAKALANADKSLMTTDHFMEDLVGK